jgi:RNA polymerase sigma-70 factor (ECF subfamily)
MIDSLDETIRIPFIMHHEGYKYNEIAEQFDLPLGYCKKQNIFCQESPERYD